MKKIKIFDLKEQYKNISKEVNKNIINILSSGQYILGNNVNDIEDKFAKYLGVNHAISCNSGTDALLLSLRAMGIGPGDEVITTPFTYFATAEVIALVGAKPIFADINPHTFNINHKLIEKLITKRTKAVIPVHIFGQPCKSTEIKKICRKYKLSLIEDCAQSFGAKVGDKYTGTFGQFGCFSFFPTKNLGCAGDGGMITTNSKVKSDILKKLRNHGGIIRNVHEYIGYNSRLDEVQASILLTKLKHISKINKKRIQIANKYKRLINNDKVRLPYQDQNTYHVYNQFTLRVKNRKKFINLLEDNNIPYGIYYPIPIYKQKAFKSYDYKYNLINAEKITRECISIPIYPELDNDSIEFISEIINKYK
tara:strand:+ start:965 stop:2062 length:1098 start_codon:yes stop_codon:yes gene_type:complete